MVESFRRCQHRLRGASFSSQSGLTLPSTPIIIEISTTLIVVTARPVRIHRPGVEELGGTPAGPRHRIGKLRGPRSGPRSWRIAQLPRPDPAPGRIRGIEVEQRVARVHRLLGDRRIQIRIERRVHIRVRRSPSGIGMLGARRRRRRHLGRGPGGEISAQADKTRPIPVCPALIISILQSRRNHDLSCFGQSAPARSTDESFETSEQTCHRSRLCLSPDFSKSAERPNSPTFLIPSNSLKHLS